MNKKDVTAVQPVIPLYPDKAPGSENWDWEEKESAKELYNLPVIYNVVNPTLTPYLPEPSIANGTSVIICPGGAFHILSIEKEGTEVAKWLNRQGITAFILKYRLAESLTDDPKKEYKPKMQGDIKKFNEGISTVVNMAIQDGKKAVEYVRTHADDYNIDPTRIGLLGFSAGGTVTMGVGFTYTSQNRPDFLAALYPYMTPLNKTSVPKDAPSIFICAASDDELGLAPQSTELYNEWLAAGKSAELHIYNKGGHGFGMSKQSLPVDNWIERFGDWIKNEINYTEHV